MGYTNQIINDRTQVVQDNKNFRQRIQEEYEQYADRIQTLANHFKWDEQKRTNALNLSITQIRNIKVQNRLKELENQMDQDLLHKRTKVVEYQKANPNAVVMQFGEQVYAIDESDPRYSPVLNGLIFETVELKDSPFKEPELIIRENEAKREEVRKKELAQQRALAKQFAVR